jgi:hypothetical protein
VGFEVAMAIVLFMVQVRPFAADGGFGGLTRVILEAIPEFKAAKLSF